LNHRSPVERLRTCRTSVRARLVREVRQLVVGQPFEPPLDRPALKALPTADGDPRAVLDIPVAPDPPKPMRSKRPRQCSFLVEAVLEAEPTARYQVGRRFPYQAGDDVEPPVRTAAKRPSRLEAEVAFIKPGIVVVDIGRIADDHVE